MKSFIAALIISSFSIGHANASEPFIWVDDEDYKPYIYASKDRQVKGFYRDIMVELFDRMKIPLSYDVFPWKRTQAVVKNGKADALISIPTAKRLVFLSATDPVLDMNFHVFSRSDNTRTKEIMAIESFDDLKGFKVIDYLGNGWAAKNFKGLNVLMAPNFTNALLMLAGERGDVFIDGSIVVKFTIKNLIQTRKNRSFDLKSIVQNPRPLDVVSFSLLIRKDSKYISIIPKFNKILKDIRRDGTYDKILSRYIQY